MAANLKIDRLLRGGRRTGWEAQEWLWWWGARSRQRNPQKFAEIDIFTNW